ncbi:ParB/RepB/Spo0J family partition protein [Burkholderiaceae bacterium FT117]|uniref:ParB/RepB/Spo0J family partition protein n=1 Tax=Zeimonas sediminis TaxID=2944268 RepID=UPI002342DB97|nr:ParB/RepB/Spo0J family partition protein [Zeimonas sediminis]MCM5571186.1 ParB/RepB/Spo0J family partition protein [Zeimonas sediminis]
MIRKQKGLGRGLEALLGADTTPERARTEGEAITTLRLEQLQAGRYQPRTRMDESALQELAASIRTHGLMQPIVVRPIAGGRWEIIAGERRFRAAGLAGLAEVPVVVREVSDEHALQLALIENIQREDLNPLEEAQAIRRLIDEFGFSHEQAADAIGRSRSATSNLLRLLNLAEPVQTMLLAGDVDMGHARALLALDRAQQIMVAHEVAERRLSVRDTERLVQKKLSGETERPGRRAQAEGGRDLARLQERLADALAAPVTIRANARGRGSLTIGFGSLEQFQGLLERLGVAEED